MEIKNLETLYKCAKEAEQLLPNLASIDTLTTATSAGYQYNPKTQEITLPASKAVELAYFLQRVIIEVTDAKNGYKKERVRFRPEVMVSEVKPKGVATLSAAVEVINLLWKNSTNPKLDTLYQYLINVLSSAKKGNLEASTLRSMLEEKVRIEKLTNSSKNKPRNPTYLREVGDR